jgi:hypothetical protein
VNIIIEVNNLVRSNYPYQRIEQMNQIYPVWGNNNYARQPSPTKFFSPDYNNSANTAVIGNNRALNNNFNKVLSCKI